MRLRAVFLSVSASLALLYPLLTWQKNILFSSIPVMEGMASWFWLAEPLLLALFLFTAATGIRQNLLCYGCIIAASFFLAFTAAEVYLRSTRIEVNFFSFFQSQDSVYVKSGQTTHLYETRHASPDPLLGFAPPKNGTMRLASRRVRDGKVLYDVLYTRDEEGRRITPDRGDKADTAILLFGCSYTVGEGLHDQETFAWRLGEMLGEKFQVFNYGYHGYGSHQMLALVESGRLDALMRRYQHIFAFYLTIPRHEKRCIGLEFWERTGPRYILENGALKHAGTLSDSEYRLFAHSRVYNQIYDWPYTHANPACLQWLLSRPLAVHAAIIAKSDAELAGRYRAVLTAVIWPNTPLIESVLRDNGVRTLPLTDAMPDYASARQKYIIKGDGHPNALAAARIAEALSEYILKNTQATEARQ